MPVDWKRYPKNWRRVSSLIRFRRAAGRCEWCGAVHGERHPSTGSVVVLTTAHLGHPFARGADKHDKTDIRAENLAALCQKCHLTHDVEEHRANAAKTREARLDRGQLPLFPTALAIRPQ